MAEPLARVPTGVAGLDEMLGGGFPARSVVLVCGGPGAGKTVLSLQYVAATLGRGEPCVYVNFEELHYPFSILSIPICRCSKEKHC